MVGHHVDDDPHPALVRVGDEQVDGTQIPEERVNVTRITDVVAMVDHRGAEKRRQPQRIHPQ